MNTLYILGGPPRTAKTTIMSGLIAEKHVQFVATDAIGHGLRNVLTGEPHQMLRDIEFSGSAEWKTSVTEGGERKPFSNNGIELTHIHFPKLLKCTTRGYRQFRGGFGSSVRP